MIELKKEFTKKGVRFKQMFKNTRVIIYELSRTYEDGVTSTWYEVLKYRTHLPDRFHNDVYEVYGSDEDCGSAFWCCSNPKVVEKVLKREFPDVDSDEILRIWSGM